MFINYWCHITILVFPFLTLFGTFGEGKFSGDKTDEKASIIEWMPIVSVIVGFYLLYTVIFEMLLVCIII